MTSSATAKSIRLVLLLQCPCKARHVTLCRCHWAPHTVWSAPAVQPSCAAGFLLRISELPFAPLKCNTRRPCQPHRDHSAHVSPARDKRRLEPRNDETD